MEEKQIQAALRIFADGERYAARGKLSEQNGNTALTYADPAMDGMSTELRFDGTSLTLTRSGAYQTVLRFQNGKTEPVAYQTPYGTISLTVQTKLLRIDRTAFGWQIDLAYEIGFGGGEGEAHEMNILITI
ncbi:MAG: DUF1934 domain-containing protein [Clostridia bacterium]|nr:DUF1934 domain-containing protein [Clostridia bacterium]MBR7136518.1 DUF1934 domain-containing protein [Clostridia bacterium]